MAAFDPGGIRRWTDELKFTVTAERIADYAPATNDPIQRHLAGDVAPPAFAIVPVFEALIPAILSVAPAEPLMKIVHGEQDLHYHQPIRPIRPGMTLVSRARPIGYQGRPTGTRSVVHIDSRDQAGGELVTEQWITLFLRGYDAGEPVGSLGAPHAFDDSLRDAGPIATVGQHIDDDQTLRYSPASGDLTPPSRRRHRQVGRPARHHRARPVHEWRSPLGNPHRTGRRPGRAAETAYRPVQQTGATRPGHQHRQHRHLPRQSDRRAHVVPVRLIPVRDVPV
jgi:hypothetical protein